MKRKLVLVILWGLVLGLMVLIFGFSAQPGETSAGVSSCIAKPVTDAIAARWAPQSSAEYEQLYSQVDFAVRKIAHFSEYAALGFCLCLLVRCYGLRKWWLPYALGTLYAATDELHQHFIDARSAQVSDVLLDSAGVLCGVLVAMLCLFWRMKWRKKHVHNA